MFQLFFHIFTFELFRTSVHVAFFFLSVRVFFQLFPVRGVHVLPYAATSRKIEACVFFSMHSVVFFVRPLSALLVEYL